MPDDDIYFRPPAEADSFIIRVMRGCSHNKCSFCNMFKGIPFEILPLEEVLSGIDRDAADLGPKFLHHVSSLYLEGGDPLALPARTLSAILRHAGERFSHVTRSACYATARSIIRKLPDELSSLRAARLERVYMGVESGSDRILSGINKGCSREDLLRAGRLLAGAGIENDVSIMLGIGGEELSGEHALATASLLNAMRPACVRIRTFVPNAGSPMGDDYLAGRFRLMGPHSVLRELRRLAAHIVVPLRLLSEHWSDFIMFDASLPDDAKALDLLVAEALEKPEPSFRPLGLGSERE